MSSNHFAYHINCNSKHYAREERELAKEEESNVKNRSGEVEAVVTDTGGHGRGVTKGKLGEGGINKHDVRLWVWQTGQKRVLHGAREMGLELCVHTSQVSLCLSRCVHWDIRKSRELSFI